MTAALGRPLWLLVAAGALVALVAWLVVRAAAPLAGTGFEARAYHDPTCSGPSETTVVEEPFAYDRQPAPPGCVEWSAYLVARGKMRFRVEVDAADGAEVSVDGRVVVTDPGAHDARARQGVTELSSGAHRIVAVSRHEHGPPYFRVNAFDELLPHDAYMAPPLDLDAYYVHEADAARALGQPPRERPPGRALFAGLLLAAAGVLAWLALRAHRRLPFPAADLGLALAIFVLALALRAHDLASQDITWDEPNKITCAQHYVHNLMLGDFHADAWSKNLEHPPVTKWIAVFGWLLGGFDGARMIAGIESSLAAAFLFAFGRIGYGRAVGLVAGALAVVLPLWVAHGRIVGHESAILFFWGGSMLALLCWMRSPRPRGDRWAAFTCVLAATLGVFCRPTAIWIVPLLAIVWAVRARKDLRRGVAALPLAGIAGGVVGAFVTFAGWPLLWHAPFAQLARMEEIWARPLGDIEFYMGKLCLPAWHYLLVAFVGETPALLLALALAGAVIALRDKGSRGLGAITLLWLVFPFGQSVSTMRIGAGRYVIQAWPALLLFAAVALVTLGSWLAARTKATRWRAAALVLPAALAVAYTGISLARTEPFPLDYWNELLGGTSGVAASKVFEVPWWGEGDGAAVRHLNATAPTGARVRLMLFPPSEAPRLRDDLVQVGDDQPADLVAVSHLQYFAHAPPECTPDHAVTAAGAALVDVYRCPKPAVGASLTDLGFGAMNRPGGAGEALADFTEVLARSPGDPAATFGLAWALQVKGDLKSAEPLYTRAADGALRAGNAEIEYFARFNLGTLYEQRGEHGPAAAAFRAAIAVADRDPARFGERARSAWKDLGRALSAAGDDAGAAAALAHASGGAP